MHNNLYKHPQQIILITFLKSEERINYSVLLSSTIIQSQLIVSIFIFRKFSKQKKQNSEEKLTYHKH